MKVAYIVPSLAPLGPVIVVRNLVERMVAHGHECTVFYFDEKPDAVTFACETRRISFWKRLDFSRYSWIHAHCFRPMLYAARQENVRRMTTLHSYLFEEYRYSLGHVLGRLLGRFTMRVVAAYDRVAVLSNDARRYYSCWISPKRLHVCYNGIQIDTQADISTDEHFLSDKEAIAQFKGENTLVVCICELVPIKNVESMIRAMALLPTNYRLLLIGSGKSTTQLKRLGEKLRVANRILFLGERIEAHRYLPLADIFAMTSLSEGFCLSLAEAAMYGKKIVCADIPGMREKYSDDTMTFFAPNDTRQLADAIAEADAHPEKALRVRETAMQRFTSEHMYNAYQSIYYG